MLINLRVQEFSSSFEGLEVEDLGAGVFRVLEVTFGTMFNAEEIKSLPDFMDVIETEVHPDGWHEMKSIRSKCKWITQDFIVSREFMESGGYRTLCLRIDSEGGTCICEMGGVVRVYVPPGSSWKPEDLDAH